MQYSLSIAAFLAALLASPATPAADALAACDAGHPARSTVMAYLRAMHKHNFGDAYDQVTATMTDGRTREDWAALQASLYVPGKVEIYGVDIRGIYAAAEDADCQAQVTVTNVLSSRDKLNEHGNIEFEIYRVAKSDDGWRIDEQETLFDDTAIRHYFPTSSAYATPGER